MIPSYRVLVISVFVALVSQTWAQTAQTVGEHEHFRLSNVTFPPGFFTDPCYIPRLVQKAWYLPGTDTVALHILTKTEMVLHAAPGVSIRLHCVKNRKRPCGGEFVFSHQGRLMCIRISASEAHSNLKLNEMTVIGDLDHFEELRCLPVSRGRNLNVVARKYYSLMD